MMARVDGDAARVLQDCRSTVLLLRQQEGTLLNLMAADAASQEEERALRLQVEGFQRLLDGTRERYRLAVVASVCEIGCLTGRDYDILCMYYVMGMSLAEIAKRMRCNIRTVTRGKSRALAALRADVSTT